MITKKTINGYSLYCDMISIYFGCGDLYLESAYIKYEMG